MKVKLLLSIFVLGLLVISVAAAGNYDIEMTTNHEEVYIEEGSSETITFTFKWKGAEGYGKTYYLYSQQPEYCSRPLEYVDLNSWEPWNHVEFDITCSPKEGDYTGYVLLIADPSYCEERCGPVYNFKTHEYDYLCKTICRWEEYIEETIVKIKVVPKGSKTSGVV